MRHPTDLLFIRGTIEAVQPVTNRMRQIRIGSERLRRARWLPGQHVRVYVTPPRQWLRRPLEARRTYSVAGLDSDRGVVDLWVLDHGDGPGAAWSRTACPGQPVLVSSPDGRFTLRESGYHLFVGDETAAVAFGAMLRSLPPGTPVYGVLETDAPGGEIPLPSSCGLSWVYRNQYAGADPGLLPAARALELPSRPGTAYLAGEARACQAVRQHLLHERGWLRQQIVVKPFWTPGRRGMD